MYHENVEQEFLLSYNFAKRLFFCTPIDRAKILVFSGHLLASLKAAHRSDHAIEQMFMSITSPYTQDIETLYNAFNNTKDLRAEALSTSQTYQNILQSALEHCTCEKDAAQVTALLDLYRYNSLLYLHTLNIHIITICSGILTHYRDKISHLWSILHNDENLISDAVVEFYNTELLLSKNITDFPRYWLDYSPQTLISNVKLNPSFLD